MRNRRGVAVGAIILSAMGVAITLTAVSSSAAVTTSGVTAAGLTAPVAPYTALTLDGHEGSTILNGTRVIENITGSTSMWGPLVFSSANPANPEDAHYWDLRVFPPTNAALVAGTTYTLSSGNGGVPTPTQPLITLGGEGRGCTYYPGTMKVLEVTQPEYLITAFAATFTVGCNNEDSRVTGEIRWNSTVGYGAAEAAPSLLSFGDHPSGASRTTTFTGRGTTPITFGTAALVGTDPGVFTIRRDTCSGATLAYGQTCSVSLDATATADNQTAGLSIPDNTTAGSKYVPLYIGYIPPVATVPPTTAPPGGPTVSNVGTYYQLTPSRILDTRFGTGAPKAQLGENRALSLAVTGHGGVPSSGVSAVVLNVTVTNAKATSYLTVWPSGVAQPTASSLNFVAGWTGANSVTVALGTDGKVNIYNHISGVDVIADVMGYYASDSSVASQTGNGGNYQRSLPGRVFDSRVDWNEKLHSDYSVRVGFTYGDSDIDNHIRAVVVNVTAVDADGPGYLTTWNGIGSPPNASTLNYTHGGAVPNLAVVPVSQCDECTVASGSIPSIGVYTQIDTHVVVDVLGFFDDGTLSDGLRFTPMTPVRITDSRIGQGLPAGLNTGQTGTVTAPDSVATADTSALAINVTAVTPTANTFLTVWPAGNADVSRPESSNLNPAIGQTVPNAVYTEIGPTNAFNIFNNVGLTHVVVDVVGSFAPAPTVQSALSRNVRSLGVPIKQRQPAALTSSALLQRTG